ncbi:hypothetical protein M9M90_01135 [Phenylobacterium sp. LH3H17]|uniref:hypothetical protein n=1 Tax=Phenylobacterium sp. LH3H17 TaxID=2903901 RepID=UPI0020C97259|nr:hypothetical protein [Phenylobacterium sp. LH3H17]UTP39808.1 hypothetical protein M9M90_01135 [Phenylobacterium sp. LH3H17]
MRLVVGHRDALPVEAPLKVALLTKAPTPEGWFGVELEAPGYARADVTFDIVRPTDSKALSETNVEWSFAGIWAVTHAAIISSEGDTLAYGPIEGPRPFAGSIAFTPGRLELRC